MKKIKFKNKEAQIVFDDISKQNKIHEDEIRVINERLNILAKENQKLRTENERLKNLGYK